MRQFISTFQTTFRNNLLNLKYFKEPLLEPLLKGLTVFVAFIIMLGFLEYVSSIIHERPTTLIDKLDVATALVGFVLMFTWKFLEKLHGKR